MCVPMYDNQEVHKVDYVILCCSEPGEIFCECDVPLIFGELCRMIDFYVGNEYIFIDGRFSKYCGPIKNYGFPM